MVDTSGTFYTFTLVHPCVWRVFCNHPRPRSLITMPFETSARKSWTGFLYTLSAFFEKRQRCAVEWLRKYGVRTRTDLCSHSFLLAFVFCQCRKFFLGGGLLEKVTEMVQTKFCQDLVINFFDLISTVLLNEREQICATWLPDTYSISGQFHRLPKYS